MGYQEIEINIPVEAHADEIRKRIAKDLRIQNFSFQIIRKSLDARNKHRIIWQYRLGISSDELSGGNAPQIPCLKPKFKKRDKHILIVGSGPAGVFPALFLALSGFKVTLIERGGEVETRRKSVKSFESSSVFDPCNNYAFGEGGAGTFSDGKLTSRTKSINLERNFIFEKFVEAGAPEEILYMTHPHLGTDNLFRITQNFRKLLLKYGCRILYNNQFTDIRIKNGKVNSLDTLMGEVEADYFILATGHSAYETYRVLIRSGVPFHTKNFAIGFRAEHSQEIINKAQWGVSRLQGINAAEYRLTAQAADETPVYSFCMCPGGIVVPATAYAHTNIVNGMSYYARNNQWANAAVVAGINLEKTLKREVSALEGIEWLEGLEAKYFQVAGGFKAPAQSISSFLNKGISQSLPASSYPFPLLQTDLKELLPESVIRPLEEGLFQFCRKLKGYEEGVIMGLESKTSSPVQVERHPDLLYSAFTNLFIAGEGSGRAGGIISSAADGIKIAQKILVIEGE